MVAVTEDRLAAIRVAFPKEGLFAEKEWLLSPDAFPIEKKFLADLEQLGHRLFVFQRACNQLYQLSVKGKQPEWVARYLDAGKPRELIDFSRRKEMQPAPPSPPLTKMSISSTNMLSHAGPGLPAGDHARSVVTLT